MQNQTTDTLLPIKSFVISFDHLISIFSLLFILILILMFLFLFFIKQKDQSFRDDLEVSNGFPNERKILSSRRNSPYSSTFHTIAHLSVSSFQMDNDDTTTRSTINLLLSK